MIKIGRVQSTVDVTQGGVLTILPLNAKGNSEAAEIQAVPCSTNIGDGHGFLSVPGPGSTVLYVEMPFVEKGGNKPPFTHVWLGAIPSPFHHTKGRSSVANDKNDPDDFNTSQKDYLCRPPGVDEVTFDAKAPEGESMYRDNNLPQQDMWKSKNGDKIVMSHKITSKGTHDNSIEIQAASGKKIRFDDGPPEMHMDRITLSDERYGNTVGPNRLEVISGGKHPNSAWLTTTHAQHFISDCGSQFQKIQRGKASQYRENQAEGNIEDCVYNGDHITLAEFNLKRKAVRADIEEVAEEGNILYKTNTGNITVDSATNITGRAGQEITFEADTSITTQAGTSITTQAGTEILNTAATQIQFSVGGTTATITGNGIVQQSGNKSISQAGDGIQISVGGSSITVTEDQIVISSDNIVLNSDNVTLNNVTGSLNAHTHGSSPPPN